MKYPPTLIDLLSKNVIEPTDLLGVFKGQKEKKNIFVFQMSEFDKTLQDNILNTLAKYSNLNPKSFEDLFSNCMIAEQKFGLKCRRLRKQERDTLSERMNDKSLAELDDDLEFLDEASPKIGAIIISGKHKKTIGSNRSIDLQYKALVDKRLPFQTPAQSLTKIRSEAIEKYPDFVSVIDTVLSKPFRMEAHGKFHIEPTLLVGAPGTGTTHLLREIATHCGFKPTTLNLAGLQDDHFLSGVSSGFSTGQASTLLREVASQNIANPIFIFDELDKAVTSQNTDISSRLLGLLEEQEAIHWNERYLATDVDFSNLTFLFTANSLKTIPTPLLSRLRVVEMPPISNTNSQTYINNIVKNMSANAGVDARFHQLTTCENRLLRKHFATHKNFRLLKKQVQLLLDNKDKDLRGSALN